MFWQHNATFAPIYDIAFVVTDLRSPPPIPNYQAIPLDLNEGADGPYIWTYVSFAPDASREPHTKDVELRQEDRSFPPRPDSGINEMKKAK